VNLLLLLDLLAFLCLLALLCLLRILLGIHSGLVDAVAITHAITIVVHLAAFDLGTLPRTGLVPATAWPASLRKPVDGQKNHCSGKKRAVSQ
jgi:hypothetical protein